MRFRHLKLSTQLASGITAVVAVFMLSLVLVTAMVSGLKDGVAEVSNFSLPMVVEVDRLNLGRSEVQQFLTDVSATHDPAGYTEAQNAVEQFQASAGKIRGMLTQQGNQDELAQLAEIERLFTAFADSGKAMAAAYLKDGMEAGNLLMKGSDGKPGFDQASSDVMELLDAFRERQLAHAREVTAADLQSSTRIQHTLLWGGLTAVVVAAMFGWLMLRVLVDQIGGEPSAAVKLMQKVGAGDLSAAIRLREGDTSSVMAHLQRMVQDLHRVVSTVREQAQGVAEASAQMAMGNQELSERTAAQASSLEETAASMAQLNGTVQQSVDGARQVSTQAQAASASANHSSDLVSQFVATMQGIEASSRQIADITSLIDGIAFQTNILALNAAVEAARAGEQGRGFAVVASEVRSLAGRSAEAAKAITGLINSSVERVSEASVLVVKARAAMTEVQGNIGSVSQSMGQVTTASAEQSAGIAVVASAVGQMDKVTQRNASLVEESAAAATALRQQALALAEAVAVFKLSERGFAPAGHAA
jgi:methyl-accepting chemotaxis protein